MILAAVSRPVLKLGPIVTGSKKKPGLKIYLTKILFSSLFCQLREFYHSKGENVIDVKVLNLR